MIVNKSPIILQYQVQLFSMTENVVLCMTFSLMCFKFGKKSFLFQLIMKFSCKTIKLMEYSSKLVQQL
ncbi:hypothetical protein DERP_003435 [Dermatophagoides pteronyssinus]|uniref:Uncharacterized protein n=1 Tax=Dermatophagoides pteronyssinus TaxID=6956 RepID=A0ABQ8JJJ1_DERPT|nr:hypothetical protein DERP_003435 [Dermatophagoides pteronyssinus]